VQGLPCGINTLYYESMIGFLIKKTFFDFWDNMFRMVLVNLGFIASLAIPIFLPGLIPIPALSILVFAAGLLWCFVYLAAAALSVKAVSDYGVFGFSDFLANLKEGWKTGLALGITGFLLYAITSNAIPFYLQMNSLFGLFLAALMFWTIFTAICSLQFFFAIRARLDTKLIKVFKKSFIIFFDNPGFALYSLLHTIVTLILSAVLALLFPGPAGLLLFLDEALRLRLLKYDWLDANPDETGSKKRRKIPWDEILIDEREKTGTRSFRSFIFPWKD
jgi:uncharacterized membrane protein YesL